MFLSSLINLQLIKLKNWSRTNKLKMKVKCLLAPTIWQTYWPQSSWLERNFAYLPEQTNLLSFGFNLNTIGVGVFVREGYELRLLLTHFLVGQLMELDHLVQFVTSVFRDYLFTSHNIRLPQPNTRLKSRIWKKDWPKMCFYIFYHLIMFTNVIRSSFFPCGFRV